MLLQVVKKGGGRGKRSKNVTSGSVGGAGAHFLNNGSNARDGKLPRSMPKARRANPFKAENKIARKKLAEYNKSIELEMHNKNARANLAKYNSRLGRPPPIPPRPRRAPPVPPRPRR